MDELSFDELTAHRLPDVIGREGPVDVVALGKASREMCAAAASVLGSRLARSIVVSDVGDTVTSGTHVSMVGDHPVPGGASWAAGEAVTSFLAAGSPEVATLVLISGGASSLCVRPAGRLDLDDLRQVWDAALRAGLDITRLNRIRASTSLLGAGALLRWSRSTHTGALVLVDNVHSGAPWVASAMTYDHDVSLGELSDLWATLELDDALRARLVEAVRARSALLASRTVDHRNAVLAEPSMMLESALAEAARRGYVVHDMGARVAGDVEDVARGWAKALLAAPPGSALVGVGEVTVRVGGGGRGGRCQELVWRVAGELRESARSWTFLARASDGRDYVPGVAGAWASHRTMARVERSSRGWEEVARLHDTYPALDELGQLIEGVHTGWNLCDVMVAVVD